MCVSPEISVSPTTSNFSPHVTAMPTLLYRFQASESLSALLFVLTLHILSYEDLEEKKKLIL
jgi:hypothetical protein